MGYALESGVTDATGQSKIGLGDSPSVDAFSRLRVAEPVPLFDTQFQYDLHPLLWETTTTTGGSATHLPNESSVRLRVTTAANASVSRQTRQYIRYQPAKSQMTVLTAVVGAAQTNVTKRLGAFDANNGVFFQQDGDGTLKWVRRTFTSGSPVDNVVAQSSWNIDKLDGTGFSRITLDITKAQIFVVDFQWLGVGRIRVGFDLDGVIVYCHEFLNSNSLSTVYMTTANLPITYSLSATGAAGAQTDLIQICSSVMSEGGVDIERGYPFSVGLVTPNSITTREPVLSIRPKATFNSIVNRTFILPRGVELGGNSDTPVYWELIYGGSLTGASWGDVDTTYSAVEKDTSATAISGGIVIASGYVNRQGSSAFEIKSRLPIVLDAAGSNPINLSIAGTSTAGATGLLAALNWLEFR